MRRKLLKKRIETKDNTTTNIPMPEISEENRQAFIRAMKIGYYKAFYKQGLLTAEQLERLIKSYLPPEKLLDTPDSV